MNDKDGRIVAGLVILGILLYPYQLSAQSSPGIQITAPPSGTVVDAGTTLTVSAEGTGVIQAELLGDEPLGYLAFQSGEGPYQFSAALPSGVAPGPYQLIVSGSSSSTSGIDIVSAPVSVIIERTDSPTATYFDSYTVHLAYIGAVLNGIC